MIKISKPISYQFSQGLTFRRSPRLEFFLDESFDVAGRVSTLIQANQSDYNDNNDEETSSEDS